MSLCLPQGLHTPMCEHGIHCILRNNNIITCIIFYKSTLNLISYLIGEITFA